MWGIVRLAAYEHLFFDTEATEPRRARSTEITEPILEPETRTAFARAALASALLGGGNPSHREG